MRPPFVGAVRLRRRRVRVPGGTIVVFVVSVLAMLRVATRGQVVGTGFGVSLPVWARRSTEGGAMVEEGVVEQRAKAEAGQISGVMRGIEQLTRAMERAASGEGVVGPPTTVGDHTVIPLIETFASGGFGAGSGGAAEGEGDNAGGGGGGGGGVGRSRTVAIADVGPDGIKIRPVVDVTSLALPAISALAALLLGRRRRRLRR
ncbi:MAG: hypothetical protein M3046_06310 [Actinomycetota bacterium]|nr:hypothetical protein [Actinomycetota bacterium]